ncbi:MAG: hypothetical protein ABIE36_01750 [Candidatus Diapherotrites archaeon]
MKNFEKNQYERRIMILIILSSFILAGLDPLFGQTQITPRDSVIESVKMGFPKIYGTIVNEAVLNSKNDSPSQNQTIKMQCYCFTLYWILLSSDKYPIPEEDFLKVSTNLPLNNSKYHLSSRLWGELKENPEKFDSIISEMVVDWIKTFQELDLVIHAYKFIR